MSLDFRVLDLQIQHPTDPALPHLYKGVSDCACSVSSHCHFSLLCTLRFFLLQLLWEMQALLALPKKYRLHRNLMPNNNLPDCYYTIRIKCCAFLFCSVCYLDKLVIFCTYSTISTSYGNHTFLLNEFRIAGKPNAIKLTVLLSRCYFLQPGGLKKYLFRKIPNSILSSDSMEQTRFQTWEEEVDKVCFHNDVLFKISKTSKIRLIYDLQ